MISGSISHLNRMGSPFAILGAVWSIYVFALQTMLRAGAGSDIRKEIGKRINPSVTYGYATAPVIYIRRAFGVCTSVFCSSPRLPFWGIGKRRSMFPISLGGNFAAQTSAALGSFRFQRRPGNDGAGFTFTLTQPHSMAAFILPSVFFDRPPIKSLIREVYEFGRIRFSLLSSHDFCSFLTKIKVRAKESLTTFLSPITLSHSPELSHYRGAHGGR